MSAGLETCTHWIYLGWTALPDTAPHSEGKTKHKKRENLTPSLADFPNSVCAHGNKQGRAEIWASFHVIPVELLEERQVSCAEHDGNKDCGPFVSTLYFLEIERKSQWNLTSPQYPRLFHALFIVPVPAGVNKAAHTDADWGLHPHCGQWSHAFTTNNHVSFSSFLSCFLLEH